MIERNLRNFKGHRHFTYYYMGRRHVIFRGKMLRTMRVFQWYESTECTRKIYDRF